MKFSFLILHYLEDSIEYTKKCVLSILDLYVENRDSLQIIVIDNGSNDGSEKILNNYRDQYGIEIMILRENKGFAEPINRAFNFSRKTFNPDFYISLNNDTQIITKDLLIKIKSSYVDYDFDMLGPRIINKVNLDQNPYNTFVDDGNNWLNKMISKTEKSLRYLESYQKSKLIRVLHFRYVLKSILLKIIFSNRITGYVYSKIRGRDYSLRKPNLSDIKLNVALHGSAIIFSKKFTDKFHFLFYPKKYFFVEEDILYYLSVKANLSTIFNPEITVLHHEDISTNLSLRGSYCLKKWKLEQTLLSLIEFKRLTEFEKNLN